MVGVYQIKNLVDGKFYIGSSVDVEARWNSHIDALDNGKHNNTHLQRAWNKFGRDNFEFSVLEETTKESLRSRETYYLQITNCTDHSIGYNMLNNANIGLGVQASEEVRKKISEACKGEKNGHYGHKHTPETIKRMRDNRWGENYVCKPRKSNYVKLSPEELLAVRKAQSERMKGKKLSDETKEKLRKCNLGRKASYEVRQKMSENRSGSKNANSKITKEQAFEIREKMLSGVHYKDVCAEYGLGQCQVYKIKRGEHWAFYDEK